MIAEKRERLAGAGFTFFLVGHNIYCPFRSTNVKPNFRLLKWLTHVTSGFVELFSGGKRIGALTFIYMFLLPYFSSRTKSYAGFVLATKYSIHGHSPASCSLEDDFASLLCRIGLPNRD